jgi:hypothetical protein
MSSLSQSNLSVTSYIGPVIQILADQRGLVQKWTSVRQEFVRLWSVRWCLSLTEYPELQIPGELDTSPGPRGRLTAGMLQAGGADIRGDSEIFTFLPDHLFQQSTTSRPGQAFAGWLISWTAPCSMFRLPFREGAERSTHALFSAMSTFCDLSDSSV